MARGTPKPAAKEPVGASPLSAPEFGRYLWGQLTSMRTALVLLFALALAAIPGSLLPQRPTSPARVRGFLTDHPVIGPIFDAVGLFDVFGSPWFAAVYLLLFISLVGCISPRIVRYVRGVRAQPPAAPERLDRLPEHVAGTSALGGAASLDAGESWLRRRGFRVRRTDDALSAERGQLREFGNLFFHISLLAILLGVAANGLFGFKGTVIVTEGGAFSNQLSQYDDFTAGAGVDTDALAPFTLWVDDFEVAFERGEVQHGAARTFVVHGRIAEAADDPQPATIEVNHPLSVGGASVNLISHGYAPVVTVTDAQGAVAFSGPVTFLPQDGNFTSSGVIKAPDARPQRLAFEAVFVPSQSPVTGIGPVSIFPDADAPELWGTAFAGEPKAETGAVENVYSLDKTGLTEVTADGQPWSFRLAPGQTTTLPDGSTLAFDSYRRWVELQISSSPGLPWTFAWVAAAIVGLSLSLFARPRRLYARVSEGAVAVGGQDRAETRTGLAEDVRALAEALGVEEPS